MKTTGSLALDTSIVVRHLRTNDQEIAAELSACTELYLPLTALGELRYGVRHSGQRRAAEQLERFLRDDDPAGNALSDADAPMNSVPGR